MCSKEIKPLTFITGNANKFKELQKFFPDLLQEDIDVPEIQDLDPMKVVKAKLDAVAAYGKNNLFVEDTSLVCEGLNGLPGTLIKWFLETLKVDGIHKVIASTHSLKATGICLIGYLDSKNQQYYFEGKVEGTIVAPRADGFGWDKIFVPNGDTRTFSEMPLEEKQKVSGRGISARKLKDFLGTPTSRSA